MSSTAFPAPISVHPSKHYFVYNGAPILLITTDHHYGAVINADFDYVAFLGKLESHGMNFTRIYPGTYLEKDGFPYAGNPLAPRSGQLILPWAKTTVPGANAVLGSYKFDLDTWDEAYFARLRDFCGKAKDRGIIVEICLYNGMYRERWPCQAMYMQNNVQGVGTCSWDMVQSLTGDTRLLSYQERYVTEITKRLNDFDNVLFHVCDEPNMSKQPADVYGPWMDRMINAFKTAESALLKKHLLGQTVSYAMRNNAADFSADSRIQYIDTEYARGLIDLDNEYGHNKPIQYIESNYYPTQYAGDRLAGARVEAWEYVVGGGAGFMHLNTLYTTQNPAGSGDIDAVLKTFVKLRDFMSSFDYTAMKRDASFIVSGVPSTAQVAAMAEPGKQYAFYIHHSHGDRPGRPPRSYIVDPGSYQETFTFNFAAGTYRAEWVNPSTGAVIGAETFVHAGGGRTTTPAAPYSIDIALRVKRTAPAPTSTSTAPSYGTCLKDVGYAVKKAGLGWLPTTGDVSATGFRS